ncbi:MAG: STAS domain-containing protein [Terriglobales bacterium]|jgi:anti-sigma B factor antagonist
MAFEITTRELDRIVIVEAVGRLTLSDSRTRLRDLIHVFTSDGHKHFLLNLAGVDFIDSDGMGELVRCYSVIRQRGGEMRLVHLQQRVQDLLQITRVNTIFEIYSDEKIALQAFRKSA